MVDLFMYRDIDSRKEKAIEEEGEDDGEEEVDNKEEGVVGQAMQGDGEEDGDDESEEEEAGWTPGN